MPPSLSQSISRRSQAGSTRRILILLSREPTTIPEGEARTLVSDLDPGARFESPQAGVLLASTRADPHPVEGRIAFSRRVGLLFHDGLSGDDDQVRELRRGTYRVRVFGEAEETEEKEVIAQVASKIGGKVSLKSPDREVTVLMGRGGTTYMALTRPSSMRQGWVTRRPRSRAFFHPSAIFPKLSRALVNFSGVQEGETLLDPFCGTGSLLIEAHIIGGKPIGIYLARKMVRGARRNSLRYEQGWLGIIRADSRHLPLSEVSAIATDIPYGRASSAAGVEGAEILRHLLDNASKVLPEGRKLVVMHPKSLVLDSSVYDMGNMRVEQEHDIYMHRKLTRTITVLRRKE
jgi:putative methyltransferase (TIGR01177 family)